MFNAVESKFILKITIMSLLFRVTEKGHSAIKPRDARSNHFVYRAKCRLTFYSLKMGVYTVTCFDRGSFLDAHDEIELCVSLTFLSSNLLSN